MTSCNFVTLVLYLFLVSNPWFNGFWKWKIIWDHFHEPQVDLEVKNRMTDVGDKGCLRTRSNILTLVLTM